MTDAKARGPLVRPVFLVAAALVALGVAYQLRGRVRGLLGRGDPPPRVVDIDGPSKVLPRHAGGDGRARAAKTTVTNEVLAIGGARRTFVLVKPTELEADRAYPLVFVFHGDGGGADSFHQAFPFERASGDEAILVYPDGIGATWDLETLVSNRDVDFVVALVDEIATRVKIDRTRVFATGYSSGGFLSNVIACQKSGLLRAIASSAGGAPYLQALVWPNGYARCPGQVPTAALAMHGQRDFAVTLDSGRFSAAYWAYVNGCDTGEMQKSGYDECHVYSACPEGKAVAFCSVPTLGHWVWDQAAEAAWTFFRTQAP